jgi:hypothetical protein
MVLKVVEHQRSAVGHDHRITPTGQRLVQALVIVGLHVRPQDPHQRGQRIGRTGRGEHGDARRLAVRTLGNVYAILADRERAHLRRWFVEKEGRPDGEDADPASGDGQGQAGHQGGQKISMRHAQFSTSSRITNGPGSVPSGVSPAIRVWMQFGAMIRPHRSERVFNGCHFSQAAFA